MNFLNQKLSEQYNKFISFEELFESDIAEKIIGVVGKSDIKFLDLGGGTGKFSEHFRNKCNWDITVADYSETMLEQAKLKNFKTIPQDLNNIDIVDKFDVIVIKFCIHYVKDNKTFYESVSKILNPDGKVFIVTRPKRTDFPFSEKLHQKWANSQPTVDELVTSSETHFKTNIETLKFPITLKLRNWKNIITNKVLSHIQDDDVEDAKSDIPDNDDDVSFTDNIILIQLALI
jgi:ubiquinone/menaquinone biosynthesis C-methylase UbiE